MRKTVASPKTTTTGESCESNGHHGELELWNVHENAPMIVGAQNIVNILGRLSRPQSVASFTYSINGSPERPVFFRNGCSSAPRLAREGDFNIDTLQREELEEENDLALRLRFKDGRNMVHHRRFRAAEAPRGAKSFRLDLGGVDHAHEVGQIVDGRWSVSRSRNGKRCLEIRPEDVGLDRIILFGDHGLSGNYRVRARLRVTRWVEKLHSVGLLFRWHPHLQGDGTSLPAQWTTGLAYYYSNCPGLRLRMGVDVRLNGKGEKVGDHILDEAILSPTRFIADRACYRLLGRKSLFPQIVTGRHYFFELVVRSDLYSLTAWPAGTEQPAPQVTVNEPPRLLEEGAVGILAHRCAAQVFDFEVEPADRGG